MKKLFTILLAVALLLLLSAGCQGTSSTQLADATETTISQEKALDIVLTDANLTQAEIKELDIDLERELGVLRYEVEFEKDGKDYDYAIHAQSGEILYKEVPSAAATPTTTPTTSATTPATKPTATEPAEKLTREEAISIALTHAGLKKSQVRDLEAELDKENGVWLYEVNFESGGYDYEYDIHAETGKILHTNKERD